MGTAGNGLRLVFGGFDGAHRYPGAGYDLCRYAGRRTRACGRPSVGLGGVFWSRCPHGTGFGWFVRAAPVVCHGFHRRSVLRSCLSGLPGRKGLLEPGKLLCSTGFGANVEAQEVVSPGGRLERVEPKIALFFLAFLPQFVSPASGNVAVQMLILGLAFTVLALLVFNVIAYFSGTLGGWLARKPAFAGGLRWLTGGVLVGLGLRLALPDQG